MDIEQLTKAQIILLTLLVSFVTSIATGIVTVTLMDQAPPAVTRTIHKVVTQTIEKVVPEETQTASAKKEIVVVKEQNMIAGVVEKTQDIFGRIVKVGNEGESFVGFGVFVDKDGILLTDSLNLKEGGKYAVYLDEERFDLESIYVNKDRQITYLKVVNDDEGIFKTLFKEATIVSRDSLKLGQSIVALGGVNSTEVLTGIISGLSKDNLSNPVPKSEIATSTQVEEDVAETKNLQTLEIKTNINPSSVYGGSPLLNLEGEVIGININPGTSSFVPVDSVKSDLSKITEQTDSVANVD